MPELMGQAGINGKHAGQALSEKCYPNGDVYVSTFTRAAQIPIRPNAMLVAVM
jgi:hypothetical protein